MTTFAELVDMAEAHLLGGDRDEINRLSGDIDDVTTTLTLDFDPTPTAGSIIGLELEEMYVWRSDPSARTCEVRRGVQGSSAVAHPATTPVRVNPFFTRWAIARAINNEINDLSAPPNGLFKAQSYQTTTQPVRTSYPLPADPEVLRILDVRYHEPGPTFSWLRMCRWDYTVLTSMPLDPTNAEGFANGKAVRIDRPMYPGRSLNIVYAAPFTPLPYDLTQDVALTGLPQSAYDIPPLGAAVRLMGSKEAKRTLSEAAVDTRRASEVPVGSSTRAATTLLQMLNQRIRTELARLLMQYPELT